MKRRVITVLLLIPAFILSACQKPTKDDNGKIEGSTILERLKKLDRVTDIEVLNSGSSFRKAYIMKFKQYIDHDNKKLGYFNQRVEIGFNGFELPTAYISEGYMLPTVNNTSYVGQHEIAFLLGCNYLFVEHRYFGDSLPVEIDYSNNISWKYLTTAQAAADAHEIVTQFKRVLDGKWLSTGSSKGGMTTEMFAYYYPGDMDLYLPYVAPFCNSFEDLRMIHFLDNETGNIAYGETKAAEMRQGILDFQIKMLKYRDELAPRFYQEGLSDNAVYSNYATADNIYDASVLEFQVGFWQYYQSYSSVKNALAMSESTTAQINAKMDACYDVFTSVVSAADMALNNEFTPYYIQAYQELGNYGYDFSHIRDNLPTGVSISVSEDEEATLMWKLVLSENQLALPKKELMYSKINNMLRTTNDKFVIIYGSSDPWYAVRPDDVTDRDNISIYVNPNYPHTTGISNFPTATKNEMMNKIKTILGIE